MSAERFQRKLLERKVREHVRLGAGEGPQTTPATAEPLEATQPLGPHENPPEVGQGPPGGAARAFSGSRAKGGLGHTQHRRACACTDHQNDNHLSNCRKDNGVDLST